MPLPRAQYHGSYSLLSGSAMENTDPVKVLGKFALGKHTSGDFRRSLELARKFYQESWFVGPIMDMRIAFFNYGFKVQAAKKKDTKAINEWLENGDEIMNGITDYVRDAWMEWMLFDNGVSFWLKDGSRPIMLNLDQCNYKDAFGREILKYMHGIPDKEIDDLALPAELKKAMKANPEVELPENMYRVLKRVKMGMGFGWPRLMGIAKVMAQVESMEVGDNVLGYLCRFVWEQHKMGHAITSGPHAGFNNWFWKKERASAFKKETDGKIGHMRITTNFDHEIAFPYPDMAHFKTEKYQAAVDRLMWWAMPLGHMILAKTITPYLLDLLRTQAETERDIMGRHISAALNAALRPPAKIKVAWSSRIFRDNRIAADLLKFGLGGGPLSQRTFLEEAGFDAEEERARKREEAELTDDEKQPAYDPAHGDPKVAAAVAKSKASGGVSGRPSGTPDRS